MKIEITTQMQAGAGEQALKQLLALDGKAVRAGLFVPELATRGATHEFGSGRIPARPWASTAADNGAPALGTAAGKAIASVADGRAPASEALDEIGATSAEQLRNIIERDQVPGPELAPATVTRKGHARKLIDSGDMVGAITHEIGREREAIDDG